MIPCEHVLLRATSTPHSALNIKASLCRKRTSLSPNYCECGPKSRRTSLSDRGVASGAHSTSKPLGVWTRNIFKLPWDAQKRRAPGGPIGGVFTCTFLKLPWNARKRLASGALIEGSFELDHFQTLLGHRQEAPQLRRHL